MSDLRKPADDHETTARLRKAVTTLAIAPTSESLTRAGRLAYNVMVWQAQRMEPDHDGAYSMPLSELVRGYQATTRDAPRVRRYIELMCTTLVRYFPLSESDAERDTPRQGTIDGVQPAHEQRADEARVFTLLSEARFSRRSGESWVHYFFPPSIRELVIAPTRWAQLDLKEMASLGTYSAVALYEICARYKDNPGGLTAKQPIDFWLTTLRHDPGTKPRPWRKFKNETLNPAIVEINKHTQLEVRLIEYRRGRGPVEAQFEVKKKVMEHKPPPVDLSLIELAEQMDIREREVEQLTDVYGEDALRKALEVMLARKRTQSTNAIGSPIHYLRKLLKVGAGQLFDQAPHVPENQPPPWRNDNQEKQHEQQALRTRQLNEELDSLSPEDLEKYARMARLHVVTAGLETASIRKRFEEANYTSPLIRQYIRKAYEQDKYGEQRRSAL